MTHVFGAEIEYYPGQGHAVYAIQRSHACHICTIQFSVPEMNRFHILMQSMQPCLACTSCRLCRSCSLVG